MIKIDTNMVIYAMDKNNKEAARPKMGIGFVLKLLIVSHAR